MRKTHSEGLLARHRCRHAAEVHQRRHHERLTTVTTITTVATSATSTTSTTATTSTAADDSKVPPFLSCQQPAHIYCLWLFLFSNIQSRRRHRHHRVLEVHEQRTRRSRLLPSTGRLRDSERSALSAEQVATPQHMLACCSPPCCC